MKDNLDIQEKLKLLPAMPGVYLMKSASGKIIYIGKARNLKARVSSYFQNSVAYNHLASQILRDKAKDLEWFVTSNEKEALILEANLAKKHSPRYNILLKDDKHFPYIKLTKEEGFPRFVVTRKINNDKNVYFGPFTDARAMRRTIRYMQKTFRIRDCKYDLPLKNPIKPCLTYHIGRCDAPCADMYSKEEYGKLVEESELFLKGKKKELLVQLQTQMKEASREQQFEKAAKVRDQIKNIEKVLERQRVDLGDESDADLISVAREGKFGCAMVVQIREGLVIDKKSFQLTCPLEQSEMYLMTQFLKSFYSEDMWIPREILVSHEPDAEENMEELLCELKGSKVKLTLPQKGEKKKQLLLIEKNAKMNVVEYMASAERKNRTDLSVESLKDDLQLKELPRRIEGFDISHLAGTDTVASMVVFKDGKPEKKSYRKFNVKTVEGIDDFASMREIIERRLKRLVEENGEYPNLMLIDGGKGQLSSAYEQLKKLGLEDKIAMIGLAKRLEEVFKPNESLPHNIPKTSLSLKLLQQLRDESHRFAITFQKSKRKKYLQASWLDEIPGIGQKRKESLFQQFKTPQKIKTLNLAEFQKVFGKKTGLTIWQNIQRFLEGSNK